MDFKMSVQEQIPYPSVDCIMPDRCAAEIIGPAYAGCESELTASCQYIFHHFNFYNCGMTEFADELEKIAIVEMMHLDILGKTLIRLGAQPVYTMHPPKLCNFFNTSTVKYSTSPQKMLMDDIASELKAIADYKQILNRLCNEQVAAIIQRIILDEELHVKIFTEMLDEVVKQNKCDCYYK